MIEDRRTWKERYHTQMKMEAPMSMMQTEQIDNWMAEMDEEEQQTELARV